MLLATGLLIWALVQSDQRLQKTALLMIVIVTILGLPTYLTGNASEFLLLQSGVELRGDLVNAHQNAAIRTLILMTFTGTFAWLGLWQFRRFSRPTTLNTRIVLGLSILTSILILQTASLGGKISHPEVRTDAQESPLPEFTWWRTVVETYVSDESWVWPAAETLHFIGMTLVFGVALLVSLRMLGMMRGIPYRTIHRILPVGILGFVVNVATGMLFFIAYPGLYVANAGFIIKVAAMVLTGFSVIYFTTFDEPWQVGPDQAVRIRPKVIAALTMVLLLTVMLFGRMIPFLS